MSISITYRTAGVWGPAGTTVDLTAAQIDANFYALVQAITGTSYAPVGISTITQPAPDQLLVTLTNATTQGPFTVPVSAFNWRGSWAASTVYAVNDTFVQGGTLYLVIFPHTSASTFDPGANDGSGHNYYQAMLSLPTDNSPTQRTLTGATYTLGATDGWSFFDCTNATSTAVTIPANATAALAVGALLFFRQAGGPVTLSPAGGVTLVLPAGKAATTAKKGDVCVLEKTATDTWKVHGDLARGVNSGLATSGAASLDPTLGDVVVTPIGDTTINAASVLEDELQIIVLTSGAVSYNLTFGTNFVSQGMLATGAVTGKRFVLRFIGDGTNYYEISRTAAM